MPPVCPAGWLPGHGAPPGAPPGGYCRHPHNGVWYYRLLEEPEPEPPFLDVVLGTRAPLAIGPELTVELPGRVLVQATVGWMPPGYGALIREVAVDDEDEGEPVVILLEDALDGAVVVSASVGWRPLPRWGFELLAGYTFLSLSAEATGEQLADLVDEPLDEQIRAEPASGATVDSSLHNFHVLAGWRWVAWQHLVIRANVGYTQTVASSSSIDVRLPPLLASQAAGVASATLDDIYTDNVKLPLFGLSAGYRF